MTTKSLLPSSSTKLERALAQATDLDALSPEQIRQLWHPQTCPESHLPWLAWALSVDFWDDEWPLQRKRDVVAGSIAWHRKKGTPWAVEQMLAAAGYADSELIEHHDMHEVWRAHGGEYLDGADTLDGVGILTAPGIAWRNLTVSWAQYIIRLNIGDKPWDRKSQREAVAICNAYAPARSELAGIMIAAFAGFETPIYIHSLSVRARVKYGYCQRFVASSFDTLDGCELLGGHNLPESLDGVGALDGHDSLNGYRIAGEQLSDGQLRFRLNGSQRLGGFISGGDIVEAPETLDDSRLLDGRYTIAGQTLDGYGALDGGDLHYPALIDPDDTLDGTSNLGYIVGHPAIHHTGLLRTWRGSSVYQEAI